MLSDEETSLMDCLWWRRRNLILEFPGRWWRRERHGGLPEAKKSFFLGFSRIREGVAQGSFFSCNLLWPADSLLFSVGNITADILGLFFLLTLVSIFTFLLHLWSFIYLFYSQITLNLIIIYYNFQSIE